MKRRVRAIETLIVSALSIGSTLACEGVLGSPNANSSSSVSAGDGDSNPSVEEAIDDSLAGVEAGPTVTLLARLTNAEFVRSLEVLLEIPAGSEPVLNAMSSLPPEPSVGGLANDANTQTLTQLAISGFERLATAAAEQVLADVATNEQLTDKLGCTDSIDAGVSECLVSYGAELFRKASRGVESPDYEIAARAIIEQIEGLHEAEGEDPAAFSARVVQFQSLVTYAALSPDFLLMIERGSSAAQVDGEPIHLTSHEIATRLSYFLSGGPPDAVLLQAANSNALATAAERVAQVDRLLSSPGGTATFVSSLVGWLGVKEQIVEAEDLDALSAYLSQWVQEGRPFNEFYDGAMEVPATDGKTTTLQVGALGAPAYLDSHTFPPTPSFITRGAFVVERLLCAELPDDLPDEAFAGEGATEREILDVHSKQPCATCHDFFDNYGAVFQSFSPEGNNFDPESRPLGESFPLMMIGDVSGEVSTLEELAQKLGASDRAPACMAQLFYRHAMRRSIRGGDAVLVTRLVNEWTSSDMSLRSLLTSIVSADEFGHLYP